MRAQRRSFRFKLAIILLVPLAALTGFWIFGIYTVLGDMGGLGALRGTAGQGQPASLGDFGQLAAVTALGAIAIVASIVVAMRVGGPIVREMRGLSAGTRDFAYRRLPLIAERVRQGVETDSGFDAPTYPFTTSETIDLVESFITARQAAVQATVQEAAVRRGIGAVFVNLARRNQTLLHRQLGLLDTMERESSDPDELENLFLLDQLATRMRRHAEGLVILSGAAPGRGWRNPVPLVDVIRGAVAEVEDYARVTVSPIPQAALAGPAVADVLHLLAELVENATLFSPPHTWVRLNGQLVGNGFAVEIEDRGLGMSAEDLAKANEMLENPPEFDLSDSSRLGFFVIGRLAWRHDVRISLRPSPYGGTTAIVLIPWSLIVQDTDAAQPSGMASVPTSADGGGEPADPHTDRVGRTERPNPLGAGAGPSQEQPGAPQPVPEHPMAAVSTETPARESSATGQQGRAQHRPVRDGPKHAATPRSAAGRATAAASGPIASEPATDSEAGLDLPRRRRQASLAPQLRADPPEQQTEAGNGGDNGREPEEARRRMASIQQGWSRGRAEPEPAPDQEAGFAGSAAEPTREEDR